MTYLSVRSAQKRYGASEALSDISLDVQRGEFVALLGPSGSGKTSLLMAVAGFIQLDSGDILLEGRSIGHLPPYKRNFGVVFQQYALFPHMTVAANIAYPLSLRGTPRAARTQAVDKALQRVRLSNYADRYPAELSGGQQQRVALARALVFEPALLLMDEPLAALDRKLRFEIQQEIRNIQRELQVTTLYVTHDQDEAMCLADRIAIVDGGKIAQVAAPLEIYDSPASAFVAGFMGEANLVKGEVTCRGQETPVVKSALGELTVPEAADLEAGRSVTLMLRPEHVTLGGPGAGAVNGVVRQTVYFGSSVRCVVEIHGQAIVSLVPRRDLAFDLAPGVNVAVSWNHDAARMLL